MKQPHILLACNNVQKLKNNLKGILPESAISLIDEEISRNVRRLFRLGYSHYLFANTLENKFWRQKVSRYYYACYNVSRSIRLFCSGDYSTDVADHRKFSDLPNEFPQKSVYSTTLTTLRDDRNMADYDHLSTKRDLLLGMTEIQRISCEFIAHARAYLKVRGLKVN